MFQSCKVKRHKCLHNNLYFYRTSNVILNIDTLFPNHEFYVNTENVSFLLTLCQRGVDSMVNLCCGGLD